MRDLLLRFLEFLDADISEDKVDEFLAVGARPATPPACAHCGSSDLEESDFKHELLRDMTERHTSGEQIGQRTYRRHLPALPHAGGPSWFCRGKDCGHHTPRAT